MQRAYLGDIEMRDSRVKLYRNAVKKNVTSSSRIHTAFLKPDFHTKKSCRLSRFPKIVTYPFLFKFHEVSMVISAPCALYHSAFQSFALGGPFFLVLA